MFRVLDSLPKLESVDARTVMQDLYETEYGIWDHLKKDSKRPLASVAFHDSEDVNTGSLLEEAMKNYYDKKIGDIYRLNFIEFLELPIDVVAMMVKVSDEINAKNAAAFNSVEKSMQLGKASK